MIALDTNILARLVTNDTPAQARQAQTLIDGASALFVAITVALELEWVLRGAYKLNRQQVVQSFEALLSIRNLNFERKMDVESALQHYRQGMDFADALHHAAATGCKALVTFDKSFIKLAVKERLMPPVQAPGNGA